MRGWPPLHAEVVRAAHEAVAEVELPDAVHDHACRELVFRADQPIGEMVSAEKAAELGLVNKAVDSEELDSAVGYFASTIASKATATVAIGKEAYYRQLDMNIDDAYEYVAEVMVRNMLEADAEEGIGAFIEKRTPEWLS